MNPLQRGGDLSGPPNSIETRDSLREPKGTPRLIAKESGMENGFLRRAGPWDRLRIYEGQIMLAAVGLRKRV